MEKTKIKTTEDLFIEQLEDIGRKSMKLGERAVVTGTPKVLRLLVAFSGWLGKKLG